MKDDYGSFSTVSLCKQDNEEQDIFKKVGKAREVVFTSTHAATKETGTANKQPLRLPGNVQIPNYRLSLLVNVQIPNYQWSIVYSEVAFTRQCPNSKL